MYTIRQLAVTEEFFIIRLKYAGLCKVEMSTCSCSHYFLACLMPRPLELIHAKYPVTQSSTLHDSTAFLLLAQFPISDRNPARNFLLIFNSSGHNQFFKEITTLPYSVS
jgi:hypothetical protein